MQRLGIASVFLALECRVVEVVGEELSLWTPNSSSKATILDYDVSLVSLILVSESMRVGPQIIIPLFCRWLMSIVLKCTVRDPNKKYVAYEKLQVHLHDSHLRHVFLRGVVVLEKLCCRHP